MMASIKIVYFESLIVVLIALFELQSGARIKDRPLSDHPHMTLDGHNKEFDHQAFLGEEARTFDQLSPEESKKRLGDLFDKIDVNDDNLVTHEELQQWIRKAQKSYIVEDIDRQWKSHNPQNKTDLKWNEYKKTTYGFMDELDTSSSDEDTRTYRDMMRRDKRRWDMADVNKDSALCKNEFVDFIHPEESPRMHFVVVEETLEDIDKDKDGKVSFDEYISDMYSPESTDSTVPDWVIREREQFKTYRDKNGDGFLDKSEIRDWIIPPDYDHSDAEASHLMSESDENKDKKLSKEEMIENYDLFVGSQATDFGEALMSKDEL